MILYILIFISLCIHLLLGMALKEKVLEIPILVILNEKPNVLLKILVFAIWFILVPVYAITGVIFWVIYANKK